MKHKTAKMLFNFNMPSESSQWIAIDDVVMGGRSESSLKYDASGAAIFSGKVSFENNGGFASIRSPVRNFDLDGFTGISLRVNGDGKAYKLRLKDDHQTDGVTYQANFKSTEGRWIEVSLPFDTFNPVLRGRVQTETGAIQPARIRQIGFLISDKQVGAFELLIAWVKGYKTEPR